MSEDGSYRFGRSELADRRIDPRKTTQGKIPIEVKDRIGKELFVKKKGYQEVTECSFEKMRQAPRKKIPENTRANILFRQLANGVILDVSRCGLKISCPAKLDSDQNIGVFFQVPGCEESGITLICQVVWQKEYADGGMSHWAGLQILKTSDDEKFSAFVDQLPELKTVSPQEPGN